MNFKQTAMIPVCVDVCDMTNDSSHTDCDGVKTVNGIAPDENGNVEINVEGGGGGVSSWNDLTDKPFYTAEEEAYLIENKAYTSYLDTQFGIYALDVRHDADGLYRTKPIDFTFDGTTRTHNPIDLEFMGANLTCYGNLGFFASLGVSAPNTGEPYVIVMYESGFISVYVMDTAETEHTISIYGTKDVHYPLDIKYTDMETIEAAIDEKVAAESKVLDTKISEKTTVGSIYLARSDWFPNGLPSKYTTIEGDFTELCNKCKNSVGGIVNITGYIEGTMSIIQGHVLVYPSAMADAYVINGMLPFSRNNPYMYEVFGFIDETSLSIMAKKRYISSHGGNMSDTIWMRASDGRLYTVWIDANGQLGTTLQEE